MHKGNLIIPTFIDNYYSTIIFYNLIKIMLKIHVLCIKHRIEIPNGVLFRFKYQTMLSLFKF